MRNIVIALFFFFLQIFTPLTKAQESFKVAETDRLRCDLGEVEEIDALVNVEMQNNLGSRGVIITYGIKGKATRYAEEVKNWIIRYRGQNPERFLTYYGGYAAKPRLELWSVPKGAKAPEINPITDNRNSSKFDEYSYWTRYEYCGDERIKALKLFAEELKQRPLGWRGYIIVYASKNLDWGRLSAREALRKSIGDKRLLTKLGVKRSRITAFVNGYSNYARGELWLVPPGATPPKPTGRK